MTSGRFLDYFGYGLLANKPVAPDLYPGAMGLYFVIDSSPSVISVWADLGAGNVWTDVAIQGATILSGVIPPIAGDGIDGDFFIDTAAQMFYGPKAAGAWPAGVSLVGDDGTDGRTILSGVIPPDDVTDGVDGDFFIDTAAWNIYGPKAAGVWPAGSSLIGPAAGVDDTAYDATTWNGVTGIAPSKNAVRDKFESLQADIALLYAPLGGAVFSGDISVPDDSYDATTWNGNVEVPTKNAIRDKIEAILAGVTFTGDVIVPDEAYDATAWNGSLEAPTKNALRDKFESIIAAEVANAPAGGIAATTVQAAINELDSEKMDKAGGTFTGDIIIPDEVYDATAWNGSLEAPTKNAIRDKIESFPSSLERPPVKPLAANFTLENPGAATLTNSTYGMLLDAPSVATQVRFARLTAGPPATPYSLITRFKSHGRLGGGSYQGIVVARNSANGRIWLGGQTGIQGLIQTFSSYSVFNANVVAAANWLGGIDWYRLRNDGTTLFMDTSADGVDWFVVGSQAIATYLGAVDQIGVGVMVNGNAAKVVFQAFEIL